MGIYFLNGNLPWQFNSLNNDTIDIRKIFEYKKNIYNYIKNIPHEFKIILDYCYSLDFKDKPDYNYIFKLLYRLYKNNYNNEKFIYEWNKETIELESKEY
jgi:hypothetical protein